MQHRRAPPHIWHPGGTYFLTWRLHDAQPPLAAAERSRIVTALRFFDDERYRLLAYVVMDDHVHVLFESKPEHRLEQLVHSWKSYTANQLQRRHRRYGALWQDGYFDRVVMTDAELVQKAGYIAGNPRRRWPRVSDYPWAWTLADEEARSCKAMRDSMPPVTDGHGGPSPCERACVPVAVADAAHEEGT